MRFLPVAAGNECRKVAELVGKGSHLARGEIAACIYEMLMGMLFVCWVFVINLKMAIKLI